MYVFENGIIIIHLAGCMRLDFICHLQSLQRSQLRLHPANRSQSCTAITAQTAQSFRSSLHHPVRSISRSQRQLELESKPNSISTASLPSSNSISSVHISIISSFFPSLPHSHFNTMSSLYNIVYLAVLSILSLSFVNAKPVARRAAATPCLQLPENVILPSTLPLVAGQ